MILVLAALALVLLLLVALYAWRPARSLSWGLICLTALPLLLTLATFAVTLRGDTAPLEEPASPELTPNPSRDPWYLLGLQESLVYLDPWVATIALPFVPLTAALLVVAIAVEVRRACRGAERTARTRARNPWLLLASTLVAGGLLAFAALAFLAERAPRSDHDFFGPYELWDPQGDSPADGARRSKRVE